MCNKLPFPHCSYSQLRELSEINDVYPFEQGERKGKIRMTEVMARG